MAKPDPDPEFEILRDLLNNGRESGTAKFNFDFEGPYRRNTDGSINFDAPAGPDSVALGIRMRNPAWTASISRNIDGGITSVFRSRNNQQTNVYDADGQKTLHESQYDDSKSSHRRRVEYTNGKMTRNYSVSTDRDGKIKKDDTYYDGDGKIKAEIQEESEHRRNGDSYSKRTARQRNEDGTYSYEGNETTTSQNGNKTSLVERSLQDERGNTISGRREVTENGVTTILEFRNGSWEKIENSPSAKEKQSLAFNNEWNRTERLSAYGGWDISKGSFGSDVDINDGKGRLKKEIFDPVMLADSAAIRGPAATTLEPGIRYQPPHIRPQSFQMG